MLQLVANYEKSLIAARTKAALAAKNARGEKVGADAYGLRRGFCDRDGVLHTIFSANGLHRVKDLA